MSNAIGVPTSLPIFLLTGAMKPWQYWRIWPRPNSQRRRLARLCVLVQSDNTHLSRKERDEPDTCNFRDLLPYMHYHDISYCSREHKERTQAMQTVILINSFEVPEGQEEQFLQAWHEAAEHLRHAPGFLSTRLHESLDPQAKFRFVNVAQWESSQHFQAALRTEAFQQIARKMPFPAYPALYRVIAE